VRINSIFGPTSPPAAGRLADVCQVGHRGTAQLTCPHRESGGYRCEMVGPHDRHQFGRHTIEHARWGNGYACSAIDGRIKQAVTDTRPSSSGGAS
jgi:hypothetical protein